MNILDQYQAQALDENIALKQQKHFYLAWVSSGFLTLMAIYLIVIHDQPLLGFFLFFTGGILFSYHVYAHIKSRNKALLELTPNGIVLPVYQSEFLWQDLGPATFVNNGEDLVLPLRNK